MKFTILLASVLGGVALGGCVDVDESSDELGEVESGVLTDVGNSQSYLIHIKSMMNTSGAGMCMDVAGGYTTTGTPIVQYPCHTGAAQKFYLARLIAAPSTLQIQSKVDPTMCVGVAANRQLALTPCGPQNAVPAATRFQIDSGDINSYPTSHGRLRSLGVADTCIDVPGGSNWQSLILQVWTCHTGATQQWELTNVR